MAAAGRLNEGSRGDVLHWRIFPRRMHFDPGVFLVNRSFATIVACSLALVAQAQAADSYPRRAGYLISNPHNYWDSSYQQDIAGLDIAILSAYPGWGSSVNTTMETAVKQIKARNSKTRVFLYVIPESQVVPVSSTWPGLGSKLDSQKWWVYPSGTSGSKIVSDTGTTNFILNITNYAKPDSSGLRFNQWFAQYMNAQIGKPNPSISGFFTDSLYWKPRKEADWNMDGKLDSNSNDTVRQWYRQGWASYVAALRSAMPGKQQIANVADWGDADAVLTELNGKLDGGLLEGMLGKSWSIEKTYGWAAMMTRYRKTMAALGGEKLGIFHAVGTPTDYQGFRYGLASCLMDNGYFAYNSTTSSTGKYTGVPQFDEYNVDLGAATSSPATSAWKSGVYRREFEKGIVLVNPKGNGAKTVALDGSFKKISGTQVPAINNGATVTSVTLNDRDGLILLRTNVAKTPVSPEAFKVQ